MKRQLTTTLSADQELQDMVNEVDTDHTGTIDINGSSSFHKLSIRIPLD